MPPPLGIAIAPADAIFAAIPTFVRLDDLAAGFHVVGLESNRGRDSERDQTGAGTCTVELMDVDGSFDPTNPSSVFAGGGLDPSRPAVVGITNPVTNEERILFTGHVTDWNVEIGPYANVSHVSLNLADAFESLAAVEIVGGNDDTTPGQTPIVYPGGDLYIGAINTDLTYSTGFPIRDRINFMLSHVTGWTAPTVILSGATSLAKVVYSAGEQILTAIMDAVEAEPPGNLFVAKDGAVVFHGRDVKFNPSGYTATSDGDRGGTTVHSETVAHGLLWSWKAGSKDIADADSTVAPIHSLSFRRSNQDIINKASTTLRGQGDWSPSISDDPTSIGEHGERASFTGDLIASDGTETDAVNADPGELYIVFSDDPVAPMSDYWVANYKDPFTRVTSIHFKIRNPAEFSGPALWALMLGVEIGDRLHLETTHWPSGLGGFDEDFFVEGIKYTARPAGAHVPAEIDLELAVSSLSKFAVNPWPPWPY